MEDRNISVCYSQDKVEYHGTIGFVPWIIYFLSSPRPKIGLDDGENQVLLAIF